MQTLLLSREEVDETGLKASHNLRAKHPYARLFGICIGYNVAASLGGVMERVSSQSIGYKKRSP